MCMCLSEREKARGRYRWGKIIEANCEHISVLLFFSFSGEGAFSCFMTIAKTTTTAAATTKLFGQKFFLFRKNAEFSSREAESIKIVA